MSFVDRTGKSAQHVPAQHVPAQCAPVRLALFVPVIMPRKGQPLKLEKDILLTLDAYLQHSDCEQVSVIPFDYLRHTVLPLQGYQISPQQWKEEIGQPSGSKFQDFLSDRLAALESFTKDHVMETIDPQQIDVVHNQISATFGEKILGGVFQGLSEQFKDAFMIDNPQQMLTYNKKTSLPDMQQDLGGKSDVIPLTKVAHSWKDIRNFLQEHGGKDQEIIMKASLGSQGDRVHTVYYDGSKIMMRTPGNDNNVRSLSGVMYYPFHSVAGKDGMLLMEKLDRSQGDVRVFAVNGKIMGSYNRMSTEACPELNNISQGARREPYQLSAAEQQRLQPVVDYLLDKDIRIVGLDLLADMSGKRYLSEVNMGPIGGVYYLSRQAHNEQAPQQNSFLQQMAGEVFDAYRSEHLGQEPAVKSR